MVSKLMIRNLFEVPYQALDTELGSIVGRDSRLWENSLFLSGFH